MSAMTPMFFVREHRSREKGYISPHVVLPIHASKGNANISPLTQRQQ
jgi:hypothetical protein